MWSNLQFLTDLVTFTEEILNRKLHFLCSVGDFLNFFIEIYFSSSGHKTNINFHDEDLNYMGPSMKDIKSASPKISKEDSEIRERLKKLKGKLISINIL